MTVTPAQKEKMLRAHVLNHRLGELEEELARMDRQAGEIAALRDALSRFTSVGADEELLVPVAPGIFARARSTGETRLLVNVGAGVVVPKTAEQAQAMVDEQDAQLRAAQDQAQAAFEELLTELQGLEREFKEE